MIDARAAIDSPAIAVEQLRKVYAGGKVALDRVTLSIPRGALYGLLGPNGAGKSTLINILAGLVNKSSGRASIWGFDIDEHPRNARASIGVVPQELVFDAFFTPFEALELQAGLYGVPRRARRTMELLRAMRLEDKAHAYARTLSGGMKRRLLIAKALVHAPPVLVLDEPTAGVDIELRQQLWAYVRELHAAGTTVVLTTHYLEEAESLCERIAIINHGRVVADEPTPALVARAREKALVATVDADLVEIPVLPGIGRVERLGTRRLKVSYDRDRASAGRVIAALQSAGLTIEDIQTHEPDLEDVFLALTAAAADGK